MIRSQANEIEASIYWMKNVEEVRGPSRLQEAVLNRMAVCHILRERGFSLKQIGKMVNRDHTTVMNSLKAYQGLSDTGYPLFEEVIARYDGKEKQVVKTYSFFLTC